MTEHSMETIMRTALWQQFGAAIAMLENALLACPETLWQEHLWIDAEGADYGTFWEITSHTLGFLDLYLTGCPFEEFTLPSLQKQADGSIPKEELHPYLVRLRQKCQTILAELSDERAQQPVDYPWTRGKS